MSYGILAPLHYGMPRIAVLFPLLWSGFVAQAQWVTQPIPFVEPEAITLRLDAVDATTAWTVGISPDQYFAPQVARTTNGGQTWTLGHLPLLTTAEEDVYGLSAVSASTAWVVTAVHLASPSGITGRILRTTDGGQTWTRQGGPTVFGNPNSVPRFIRFFSVTEGVAGGEQRSPGAAFELYTTADAGQTWTALPNAPATLTPWEDLIPLATTTLGSHIWFVTSAGRVFHSATKGLTWTVGQVPGGLGRSPEIASIAFRDAQNGLLSVLDDWGSNHLLFATTNGGATWVAVTYAGPLHGMGLSNVPGTGQYVSTGANLGNGGAGSSYSGDDGQTWTAIDNRLNHLTVEFVSPTVGWSGRIPLSGSSGGPGVSKFTGTLLGTRTDVAPPAGLHLFPNPAVGGHATLQTARPLGSAAQVRVLDATSRVVREQRWDGVAPVSLDLSHVAAGLYVLEVQAATGTARQKLVLP